MSDNLLLKLTLSATDKMSKVVKGAVLQSDKAFNDLRQKISSVSDSMDKLGKDALVAGGIMAAPLVVGVKKAADFGAELSNIKAITGETNENMEKLRKLALKMGADTQFSALEAAQAITELQKAGVSTAQILGGALEGSLNLAAAGDLELAESAEIASTALNAFRDDNISVSQAADILAGAANASATSVGELKYSLSMTAAVASGFGMSFKDVNIALAMFAQNGLKGSDAGTSLKTMLMNLQPRTDEQIATFVKLGLAQGKLIKTTKTGKEQYQLLSNAFFDSKGNIKSITEISGLLHDKLKNLTNQERLFALETMFGADAIRAANILYKEGADGATKMWGAMSKVKAADVAKTKMDNLKGAMEELSGSIETISITAGEKLVPAIRILTDMSTVMVNMFGALPEPLQSAIVMTSAFSAVALIGFGAVTLAASAAMKGFSEYLEMYRNVIRYTHKNKISLDLINPITAVQKLDSSLRNMLHNSMLNVYTGFQMLPSRINLAGKSMSLFMLNARNNAPMMLASGFKYLGTSIVTGMRAMWGLNAALLTSPITWIGIAIAGAAIMIYKYWKPISGFFRGLWAGIVEGTKPLHPIFNRIGQSVSPLVNWFKALIKPVDDVGGSAEKMGVKIGKAIGGAITWVVKLTKKIWDLLKWTQPLYRLFKGGKWAIEATQKALKGAQTPKGGQNSPQSPNDEKPQTDGSHREGLDYVPYDGYVAELHKGERVLTSGENRRLTRTNVTNNGGITLNYSPVINASQGMIPDIERILRENEARLMAKLELVQRRREARSYA